MSVLESTSQRAVIICQGIAPAFDICATNAIAASSKPWFCKSIISEIVS